MTTTRLFQAFICLLLVGGFWGCADHRFQVVTPGINRLRVKTITQQVTSSANASTVSAFSYDSQGRLSSILAYRIPDSTAAPVENTLYLYDAQNRLIQVQHAVIRRGSSSEQYTLLYNSAGQVAQLTNSLSTFSITPRYNSANQMYDYGKQISFGGLSSSGGGTLSFTGNNLTAASETFSVFRSGQPGPAVYNRSTNTTYTFDDKVNPFYGLFIIPAPGVFAGFPGFVSGLGPVYTLYGGIDNSFNLSQNNVLSALITNGETTSYSYTYNTSNLPISRTTTISTGVSEVLRYEYEPY